MFHLPAAIKTLLGFSSMRTTETDLSQLAVAMSPSSKYEKSTPTTNSVWLSNLFMGCYVLQSQIIVAMSYEAEARMFAWKGENLMRRTASECPVNIMIGVSVVALKSQTLIILSVEAVAKKFSYLLKSMESTSLLCAWIFLTSLPDLRSQILAV